MEFMINMESLFRLFGCILILFASTGIGISISQDMQRHVDELEEIQRIFYLLRSEIQYTHAPFAEVFEKIGKKTTGRYGEWLIACSHKLAEKRNGSFWEIWCDTIDEHLGHSSLKNDELEELKNVGKNLEYIESIDLYIEQMEYRIKHTKENARSKKKICKSMGITGGVFLVILLI